MPSFTNHINDLRKNGPIIPVMIGVPNYLRNILQQNKQTIIPPHRYNALIDTGATSTCISPNVFQQLKLTQHGITNILTAGKPTQAPLCDIYINLGISFKRNIIIDPFRISVIPLQGQDNIDCLIGRDILSRGTLIYIGYANTISLSL